MQQPALRAFMASWARGIEQKAHSLPRYSPAAIMINDIHVCMKHCAVLLTGLTQPDPEQLLVALATVYNRLLPYEYPFKVGVSLQQDGDTFLLTPTNLPTLILLAGKEMVPRGLAQVGVYHGEHTYRFISQEYSIR
ncbi:MAG: hypothetical protein H6550_16125 [Chitinophagales bacterium]|nr:hypothetical protein [Chitinophagales bacterium]